MKKKNQGAFMNRMCITMIAAVGMTAGGLCVLAAALCLTIPRVVGERVGAQPRAVSR